MKNQPKFKVDVFFFKLNYLKYKVSPNKSHQFKTIMQPFNYHKCLKAAQREQDPNGMMTNKKLRPTVNDLFIKHIDQEEKLHLNN